MTSRDNSRAAAPRGDLRAGAAGREAGPSATVHILMATLDGALHLPEQLDSIRAQDHGDWNLWASDDGSTDATPAILRAFSQAHPGRVRLLDGPRRGSAANFLSLIGHPDLPEGPVALADQDDVWLPHRLGRALDCLARGRVDARVDGPVEDGARVDGEATVYASRTLHVDARLRPRGPSRLPRRTPCFANALVQNVLAGNTLVLDAGAMRLLRATIPAALAGKGAPHHDWWVYLVATGAGARIVVDPRPGLLYRQHGANHMGAHQGPLAALARARALGGGDFRDWMDRNLAALEAARDVLSPEALALARSLGEARARPTAAGRLRGLRALPIHRQTAAQDLALAALAGLGWL